MPFERLIALPVVTIGVVQLFDIGSRDDPLDRLLPTDFVVAYQVFYIAAGLAVLIGLGVARGRVEALGLVALGVGSIRAVLRRRDRGRMDGRRRRSARPLRPDALVVRRPPEFHPSGSGSGHGDRDRGRTAGSNGGRVIAAVDPGFVVVGVVSGLGGLMGGYAVWRKVGPQRTQVVVSTAEKAFVVQGGVLDDVYSELERQKRETHAAREEAAACRERVDEFVRTSPSAGEFEEMRDRTVDSRIS